MKRGKSDAETCRLNRWTVGTLLVGDEGHGPTVIRITAVGEENILARDIMHANNPTGGLEMNWTLENRDWKVYRRKP